jgi:rRNA maturation RNase YbeY
MPLQGLPKTYRDHLSKARPQPDRTSPRPLRRPRPQGRALARNRQHPAHLELRDEIPESPFSRKRQVLAFPAEPDPGISPRNQPAGEIAISAEIASHNARKLGHSPAEEIKILVLHGLLHLRGYDHECDNGEMAEREQQLRAKLYLPLGLIERTDPPSDTSKPQTRKQPQR